MRSQNGQSLIAVIAAIAGALIITMGVIQTNRYFAQTSQGMSENIMFNNWLTQLQNIINGGTSKGANMTLSCTSALYHNVLDLAGGTCTTATVNWPAYCRQTTKQAYVNTQASCTAFSNTWVTTQYLAGTMYKDGLYLDSVQLCPDITAGHDITVGGTRISYPVKLQIIARKDKDATGAVLARMAGTPKLYGQVQLYMTYDSSAGANVECSGIQPTPTPIPTNYFAFVGNVSSKTVSMFKIDGTSGLMTANSPASINPGNTVISLATYGSSNPSAFYVYQVGGTTDNLVHMYTMSATTGLLTATTPATIATDNGPYHITTDPWNRFAYVVNIGTSYDINMYTINSATGVLTATSPATVATGTKPYGVVVDATGRFAYVVSNTSNTVWMYLINQGTGVLAPMSPATIATGAIPYAIAIDPQARFVYTPNEADGTISMYTINQTTGVLTATSPATIATGVTPVDFLVDPKGRFGYLGGLTTVSSFTINQSTGVLTATTPATIAGGTHGAHLDGAHLATDPSGQFLYAPFQGSNKVYMYKIDQGTGVLTANSPATIATGTLPAQIVIPPAPPALPIPCFTLPSGSVSWWQAESNALDQRGANNGAWEGSAAYTTGEEGQAFSLNGTTNDVKVTASSNLNVGTGGGITLEAWVKPADTTVRPILEWNDGSWTGYGPHLWASQPGPYGNGAGCLFANLIDNVGGSHILVSAAGILATGVWSHVAVTYSTGTGYGYLYVNGAQVASSSLGTFTPRTTANFYIGSRPAGSAGAAKWSGQIDEAAVYNRALSATEIVSIYAAGSSGKCPAPTPTPTPTASPTPTPSPTPTASPTPSPTPPSCPGCTVSYTDASHTTPGNAYSCPNPAGGQGTCGVGCGTVFSSAEFYLTPGETGYSDAGCTTSVIPTQDTTNGGLGASGTVPNSIGVGSIYFQGCTISNLSSCAYVGGCGGPLGTSCMANCYNPGIWGAYVKLPAANYTQAQWNRLDCYYSQ